MQARNMHVSETFYILQTTEAVSLEESLSICLVVPATQPVELLRHLVHAPVDLQNATPNNLKNAGVPVGALEGRCQSQIGNASCGGGGGGACHNNIPGAWRSKEPSLQT